MLTSIRGLVAATALAGCAMAATPALADETAPPSEFTITGNVALVTDYRFRGLSQSNGDPAVQGGININHKSGVYVGAWSSSIDFPGPLGDVYGSQELDLFGGWTGPIASGVTADVGLLYYAYPSGHVGKAEFFEPYASVSGTLGPVAAKVGVNYAWKQEALTEDHVRTADRVDPRVDHTADDYSPGFDRVEEPRDVHPGTAPVEPGTQPVDRRP